MLIIFCRYQAGDMQYRWLCDRRYANVTLKPCIALAFVFVFELCFFGLVFTFVFALAIVFAFVFALALVF